MPSAGLLTVICGPMFSGKTETLMRAVRRAAIADLGAQIFKPTTDKRDYGDLKTHSGQSLSQMDVVYAVTMIAPDDLFAITVRPNISMVFLDEAQFFEKTVLVEVSRLLTRGVSVTVAGLDKDSNGCPFGFMPELLADADRVQKLAAVCSQCKTPDTATMTARRPGVSTAEKVLVGGSEAYVAVCRTCWYHLKNQILPLHASVQVR